MRTDPLVWPAMVTLADCLSRQLEQALTPQVCNVFVLPGGQPALDFCDPGMAWVRLISITEEGEQNSVTAAGGNCVNPLRATLEVGVSRCAPVTAPNSQEPPTMAQWFDVAELVTADMHSMRLAIVCCDTEFRLGTYAPFGPMGACVGGVWSATYSA